MAMLRALGVLGIGALVAACNEADPAKYRVDVVFPSTAMAIASEDLRITVFDDPKDGACQRIYLKWITGQSDLPPVVSATAPIPVCEIAFGRPPTIELPVGKRYSVLAVALRGNEDLLVGCSEVSVSSDDGEVSIYVGLPGATPVPPIDKCTSFEDVCFARCP
jgi:hypothetical protein